MKLGPRMKGEEKSEPILRKLHKGRAPHPTWGGKGKTDRTQNCRHVDI